MFYWLICKWALCVWPKRYVCDPCECSHKTLTYFKAMYH